MSLSEERNDPAGLLQVWPYPVKRWRRYDYVSKVNALAGKLPYPDEHAPQLALLVGVALEHRLCGWKVIDDGDTILSGNEAGKPALLRECLRHQEGISPAEGRHPHLPKAPVGKRERIEIAPVMAEDDSSIMMGFLPPHRGCHHLIDRCEHRLHEGAHPFLHFRIGCRGEIGE